MKKVFKGACGLALAAALAVGGAVVFASCDDGGTSQTDDERNVSINTFSLDEVTLSDAYCVNATQKEVDYLLKLDSDRLLANFYKNAAIESDAEPYSGGWEDALIGGHTLGHYLTAISQAYASANVSDSDRTAIKEKLDYIVGQLKICQENSQGEKGFIWGGKVVSTANYEIQFDNVEEGKTNISTQAWVPWYTMHKILAGLISAYELVGSNTALEVATNLGDWVYNRVSKWSEGVHETVLSIEYGGMNDCLYELYYLTGDDNYAVAAHMFDEESLFKKVKKDRGDVLNNKHANTTIPKFLGALNRYVVCNGKTIDGEVVDASAYLEYVEYFWDMVTQRHTYITGDCSEWEHFGADYVLVSERTNCNCETCCSYNMLKMSRLLFQITGDVKYLNYYENAFVNTILSSQNPETGMSTYFQPMATGYFKVYSTEETNFWCCTGSGMENFTKLNDSIYYKNDNSLYVSLYLSSTVVWEEQGVTLKQTSDLYDGGDSISFAVEASKSNEITLNFRIPDWAAGDVTVKVNGTETKYTENNGFAAISGKYAVGDVITLSIPEEVEAHKLSNGTDSDGNVKYNETYAFTYGPLVLSAEMGTEDMKTSTTGVNVTIPTKKYGTENIGITGASSIDEYMENINDYLVKVDGDELKFKMTGADQDYIFSIHYKQYTQRYGIYFKYALGEVVDPNTYNYDVETIDTVQPGYGQYENDELHNMQESGSVGVTNDGTYRYAEAGGYFTYNMTVNADMPNYLKITLRKADNGKGVTIKIGDTEIYSKVLSYEGPDDEYSVTLRIPDEVVAANISDKSTVPVTFSGVSGGESAKICNFVYMQNFNITYTPASDVYYFVDCGDYNVNSCSEGDSFGLYNSVTEQVYGEDLVTGKYWGITDDVSNENRQGCANGIGTAWSWAYEYNDGDGLDKTASNRYTKNQYENDISRHLDYAFELEDGEYTVEVAYSNPWNCSSSQTLTAYAGEANEQVLLSNKAVSSSGATVYTATVTVSGGKLTLHFTSTDLCINVCYIKISK